jgi:hypothetical protein
MQEVVMEIRRKAIGIVTCLLLVTMVLAGVPSGVANATNGIDLTISLETDKNVYCDGGDVTITVKATNNDKQNDVTLTFPTAQLADFRITLLDGTQVYQWSSHQFFYQVITEKTIPAGETLTLLTATWSQVDDAGKPVSSAPYGKYRIEGWMVKGTSHSQIAATSKEIVIAVVPRPIIDFKEVSARWAEVPYDLNWGVITPGTNSSFTVTIKNIGCAPAHNITVQAEILDPALYLDSSGNYGGECTIVVGDVSVKQGEIVAIADVAETLYPGDEKEITFTVQVPTATDLLRKGFRAIGLTAKYYKYGLVRVLGDYPGPYYSYPPDHWRTVYFFAGDTDWKADVMVAENKYTSSSDTEVRYKLEITLTYDVEQASLCVLAPMGYELYVQNDQYVNPVKVYETVRSNVFPVDLTDYLCEGDNTIEIRAQYYRRDEYCTTPVLVEGGILLKNGNFIRIAPTFPVPGDNKDCYAWQNWNGTDWQKGGLGAWKYLCTNCGLSNVWMTVTTSGYHRHAAGIRYYLLNTDDTIGAYRFPPNQGPIYVEYPDDRPAPIFDRDKGVKLFISIPKSIVTGSADGQSLELPVVIDGFTGEKQTVIDFTRSQLETTTLAYYTLSWTPDHGGVWDVYLTVSDSAGNIAAERYLEVAVVDTISQNEVAGSSFIEGGLDKKVVETIDCSGELGSYGIDEPPQSSERVDGYRETGQAPQDGSSYFSYAFEVSDLSVPYLVEVEYPDNEERAIGLRIGETVGLTGSVQKAAFVTWVGGNEYPNSPVRQKIYALYWPSSPLATVEIINFDRNTKAAASKITIYKITDDLPALKINNEQKDRLFGLYSERAPLITTNFGQPWLVKTDLYQNLYTVEGAVPGGEVLRGHDHPGFYKDWYVTISNLIKYMKFSGQNVYLASLNSYYESYYPSTIPDRDALFGYTKDYIDLMAKMFENNDLSLILALQFTDNYAIRAMDTPDEDWSGNPCHGTNTNTIRMITKDGYQLHATPTDGGFNYFIPQVEAEVMNVLDEIGDLYSRYPAIKGICFHGAMSDFPGWSSFGRYWTGDYDANGKVWSPYIDSVFDVGYDDLTWAQFRVSYPSAPNYSGADRFHKRYIWVMTSTNMNKWISWRCEMTADQITLIKNHVNSKAPDWKIYLSWWDWPLNTAELNKWTGGTITYNAALREYGFDISLPIYNDNNVVVVRAFAETPERTWSGHPEVIQGADILSGSLQGIADTENFAQGLRRYWPEGWLSTNQNWVWTVTGNHFWGHVPPDRYFAREYVASLKQAVPNLIFFFQSDCNILTGSEQGMRHFAQAYRTIPPGHYQIITNNIPQGLTIGLSDDLHYLYIANQSPYKKTVTVYFSGPTVLMDLVALQGYDTSGDNSIVLQLSPYDLKTFGELFMPATVTSATVIVCFIATAAYGTPMAKQIQILREFRDEYLLTNPLGQALVNLYYRVSPPIAEFITEHPSLKPMVRAGLVPAVAMSYVAVNTTPAEKMAILGLLVLVSMALAVWTKRRRGKSKKCA